MNIRKIAGLLAPVAAGAALAAVVQVAPANAATVQFTAHVQAPNRILTSQPVFENERLIVAGFAETVTSVQDNGGGGSVAWLQFALPSTARTLSPVVVTVVS